VQVGSLAMIAVGLCYVVERTTIMGSFGRSAELTRGNRWQIFGLLVIVIVVEWVISLIFNMVSGVSAMGMSGDPAAVLEKATSPLVLSLSVVRSVVSSVIGATAAAVIYVELRKAHEGEPAAWLADIFR